jgi:hypothetical protein
MIGISSAQGAKESEEVRRRQPIWMRPEGIAGVTNRTKKLLPRTATILRLAIRFLQVTHRLPRPFSGNTMWNEYVNVLVSDVINVLARGGIRRV